MPFAMPPGLRIPYDIDGSVILYHPANSVGGGVQEMHANAAAAMNSTYGGGAYFTTSEFPNSSGLPNSTTLPRDSYPFFVIIFPLPTRIRGLFYSGAAGSVLVETSKDTTNGIDGTWTHEGQFSRGSVADTDQMVGARVTTGADQLVSAGTRSPKDFYRLLFAESGAGIHEVPGASWRNVRAIRVFPVISNPQGEYHIHLYGEPDTDAIGQNYLQGWRADSNMRLGGAALTWGDVPLESSSDKTFRLKNQSATDTANSIVVSAENLRYYPTPSLASQFLFSLDGATWTPTVTIGAIGPGAVSSTIYVRRVTPANSPLTTWSPRFRFAVGSWT